MFTYLTDVRVETVRFVEVIQLVKFEYFVKV